MNVMKLIFLLFLIPAFFGCDIRKREKHLNERTDSVNQKEQRLILLENQLNLQKKRN